MPIKKLLLRACLLAGLFGCIDYFLELVNHELFNMMSGWHAHTSKQERYCFNLSAVRPLCSVGCVAIDSSQPTQERTFHYWLSLSLSLFNEREISRRALIHYASISIIAFICRCETPQPLPILKDLSMFSFSYLVWNFAN